MRFALTDEQRSFADALDKLCTAADLPAVNRAWADGDTGPGRNVWDQLAGLGLTALLVDEDSGGVGGTPLDLAVAFEQLGRHNVPGPWVESVAVAPVVLAGSSDDVIAELAEGTARVTFAAPPRTPYALDADAATHVYLLDSTELRTASTDKALKSVDPTRTLSTVTGTGEAVQVNPDRVERALDLASLATAAQLVGAADRMLTETVAYVQQRQQFGRVIGEYQAVKHQLADVRVAVDFARPTVHGAAHQMSSDSPLAGRDVAAAAVMAGKAAHLAARTSLQAHGAIGYTLEHDLSLWLLRTRALLGAWGTPADHRARVLSELEGA